MSRPQADDPLLEVDLADVDDRGQVALRAGQWPYDLRLIDAEEDRELSSTSRNNTDDSPAIEVAHCSRLLVVVPGKNDINANKEFLPRYQEAEDESEAY